MLQQYLEGLMLGAPAVLFVGPVLLTLLQASLKYNFKAGFAVAAGITVSDIVCIALCYVGVSQVLQKPTHQTTLSILGGFILIAFGIASILTKLPKEDDTPTLSTNDFVGLFSKGFVVNFANPVVFAYWIGALGYSTSRHGTSILATSVFFAGSITVIFVTDTLKAFAAHKLKHLLRSHGILWINRTAGVGLIGFGIYLLWRTLLV